MLSFQNIRHRVSNFQNPARLLPFEMLHIAENHIRIRPAETGYTVRRNPEIRFIALCSGSLDDGFHHDIRIACRTADLIAPAAQLGNRVGHIRLDLRPPGQQGKQHRLKIVVQRIDVPVLRFAAEPPPPFAADPRHVQHRLDMIPLQHAHRPADFLICHGNASFSKNFPKDDDRCHRPKIDSRTGPIKNNSFPLHASAPFHLPLSAVIVSDNSIYIPIL